MRVGIVNALSYPGFVSGATLQAHRVAVALHRRGHVVAVFSGARRPGSRSFAVSRETADEVPVTSINTEDFQGFADRQNFDNPGVAGPLNAWIDEFQPDLIHAHSLQGLGAGWIDDVAAARPVLVTMHDWWWICARQFLVTEDLRVDAPLVDVEGCACSGGVAFNQQRRAWLAERLRHTWQVLVPSKFMRESLLVNGFEPDRVVVDINGVDGPGRAAAGARPEASPPVLGFVGGEHDFKGFPLLVEARRRLADDPLPMRIRAWGAGGSVASRHLPPGMEVLPGYRPQDTPVVMAGIDALAVPSLMRESSSNVVREALMVGTPVITADSGGPEDVVTHGDNGLVVETGSPAAWAAALRRWSSDADLRSRLREGARRPREWPTFDDQAGHLETLYQAAVAAGDRRS